MNSVHALFLPSQLLGFSAAPGSAPVDGEPASRSEPVHRYLTSAAVVVEVIQPSSQRLGDALHI